MKCPNEIEQVTWEIRFYRLQEFNAKSYLMDTVFKKKKFFRRQ